jgi:hypothetical protein
LTWAKQIQQQPVLTFAAKSGRRLRHIIELVAENTVATFDPESL